MPSFFFVNHQRAWNTFRAIVMQEFNALELVADFEKEGSMNVVNLEKPNICPKHITGSLETYENVREEITLYLQVYNNASPDKFDLKLFSPIIRKWLILHRNLTLPGGSVILTGKQGSSRLSLTRLTAQMLQFNFIHFTHDMYLLRDVYANCTFMEKKCLLFIRHIGSEITETLLFIIDFFNTC